MLVVAAEPEVYNFSLTSVRLLRVQQGFCAVAKGLYSGSYRLKNSAEIVNPFSQLLKTPNRRIAGIAFLVVVADQLTKAVVQHFLDYRLSEKVVIPGFFKFVHWGNTGAAWSLFRDNNLLLAAVAIIALGILYFSRHHFDVRTTLSQLAFGFICGGIVGNLIDRLRIGHVVDFLYFYVQQRGGGEVGFPAFNVADSAICTGVGLIFLLTLKSEGKPKPIEPASAK